MKISLIPLALSLSVPAFAGSSALDALGGFEAPPQLAVPSGRSVGVSAEAAALISLISTKGVCVNVDAIEQDTHGAPMCVIALAPEPQLAYMSVDFPEAGRGRRTPYQLNVRRDIPAFKAGLGASDGKDKWVNESRLIRADANGSIIEAVRLVPSRQGSFSAGSSSEISVVGPNGESMTLSISYTRVEMTPAEIREELARALAAAKAATGRQVAAPGRADIASLGAALRAEFSRRSRCYDGSDPAVHGAPMCALALSNDPAQKHYITGGLGSRERGGGGELSVRREVKLFPIGRSTLTDYVSWAVESRDITVDEDGSVISANVTRPAIYAAESACPSCAFEPYRVRDAFGAEKTVLIGRKVTPLSEDEIRAELEMTLAAVRKVAP